MKLLFDRGGQVFLQGNEADNEPEYWKSRLAFSAPVNCGEEKCWEVIISGLSVRVDAKARTIHLPETISDHELCYVLRVMTDAIQLLEGRMPLHAGGIVCENRCMLLFANSGAGKSYLAELLRNMDNHCRIIGDDHIYLLPGGIQGNQMRRLRNEKGDTVAYKENAGYSAPEEISGVCFRKAEENVSYELPGSQWYESLKRESAFKYAGSRFWVQGREYDPNELFQCDIGDLYVNALKSSVIRRIFMVSGTHDYGVACIRKYMRP